jgi:uncharacterized protein (DUF1778 family)
LYGVLQTSSITLQETIMANTTTLSIKTDHETKETIRRAAERLGLSVNSFVLMVAKNAAEADEIVLRNHDIDDLRFLSQALEYNQDHDADTDWDGLKEQYGL